MRGVAASQQASAALRQRSTVTARPTRARTNSSSVKSLRARVPAEPKGPVNTCYEALKLAKYRYEVTTGLYMMEPWEKTIFNSILIVSVCFSLYTAYVYLPSYLQNLGVKIAEYSAL
ncbi:hypothetical protein H4R34_000171 [Dimargaris verticillata]|uniref:Uncharacterized protein n=1 Tax=Dimargaris verticillata TaxID=2761393 RepID=A0A9W8EC49_9FUNG|nr:hypothetical protein H4R34_000171 [Dimargaris verticillata]